MVASSRDPLVNYEAAQVLIEVLEGVEHLRLTEG